MKLTRKARLAISDAVYAACDTVQSRYIRDLHNRPPEDWTPQETTLFDLVGEIEDELTTRLAAAFPPA